MFISLPAYGGRAVMTGMHLPHHPTIETVTTAGGLSRDRTTPWTAADVAWTLLPAVSVAFVLSGMMIGSTMDDEEYRNLIASVVLQARALLDGVFPFWTSDLGFGLP